MWAIAHIALRMQPSVWHMRHAHVMDLGPHEQHTLATMSLLLMGLTVSPPPGTAIGELSSYLYAHSCQWVGSPAQPAHGLCHVHWVAAAPAEEERS